MEEIWLTVGEVARRAGLTIRTLHHYDELGLLVPSGRSAGDYRLYNETDLRRLLAIQQLKSLGLSLEDVADALDDPAFDASDAIARQIAVVEARLDAERRLLERLTSLRDATSGGWSDVVDAIALTERLQHPSSSVRVRALLDAPASAPLSTLIATLFAEDDPSVVETVTWAIARHGMDAVAPLAAHLADPDAEVRRRTVHALGKLNSPEAAALVAPLLGDPSPAVSAKAAFVLGSARPAGGVQALLGALHRAELDVADAVTNALASYGRDALPGLLDALRSAAVDVRRYAADALALLAAPDSDAALTEALDDPDAEVRLASLTALGQLGTPAAHAGVRRAASSDDPRVAALASRLISG